MNRLRVILGPTQRAILFVFGCLLLCAFELKHWNGSPTDVMPGQTIHLKQSIAGDMVLAALNLDTLGSEGLLSISSGGREPEEWRIPAAVNIPSFQINNWDGDNVTVANISPTRSSSVKTACFSFGRGSPITLKANGIPVPLKTFMCTQATPDSGWFRISLFSHTSFGVFVVFIGSKASVFCINVSDSTQLPTRCHNWSSGNRIALKRSFSGENIYIVNLSPLVSDSAWVTLQRL